MRPFLLLATFLLTLTAARAQSVHWENADSGDPSDVQLVFTDCSPDGDPQLPKIDGTTLALAGRSENMSVVNFSMTRSVVFSYRARTTKSGPLQIPAFTVQTNKGAIKVPAFTGGTPRTAADANILSRLEPGSRTVWAGEVFPLNYTLDVARRSFSQLGSYVEWDSTPLLIEEWTKPTSSESISNGEPRLQILQSTRAYAKSPGSIQLNAANQLVNIQTGSVGFGLFQTPRVEQLAVSSDRPTLNVRPLPPAPAGYRGAVGQFKFTSKVVPTKAAVGEPITWTLELSGTGNWPDIAGLPQRDVSKDFNVVSPQAKRTPIDGKLFDVTLTEDVVLVPTRDGTYTLAPVAFTYFDPATGDYQTITTPRTTITINAHVPIATAAAPAPAAGATATGSPAPSAAVPTESKIENPKSKIPVSPLGIPRDPLAGSHVASAPLGRRTLLLSVLAPFVLLPLVWLALALRRAAQTDPRRRQREARDRLAATLSRISNLKSQIEPPHSLLLAWQHDAAILFQLPHAAPSAVSVGTALRAARPALSEADAAAWSQLWLESDRALYGATAALPSDWVAHAEAALAAHRVPAFQPLRAFLPRNLFPFVAAIAIAFALTHLPSPLTAGTPNSDPRSPISAAAAAAAYRSGDFAAAEKSWADTLAKSPTDAAVRHNLSLALAQQDRWAEAAAQAAAAFVQSPDQPAIRWQLALACNKAGYAPAALAAFLPPGPLQSLAGHASPTTWQYAAILAAVLAAAALATLIYGAYARASLLRTALAFSVLGLATLLGLASVASLHAYGDTADARAVIVWRAGTLRSIPTEADTTQKTTPLAAGTLGLEDKSLLGWVRLRFDNGQTGWVRREEVIALWR